MSIVYANSIILDQTFLNNQVVVNVNCNNRTWLDNTMYGAFYNSRTIDSVTGLNNSVTNMTIAFGNCTNLKSSPTLPSNVTTLDSCFINCTNLTSTPTLPNSVVNLSATFYGCSNLIQVNEIPDSVINMEGTFYKCHNLTSINALPNNVENLAYTFSSTNIAESPTIPNSVTNMYGTFGNCTKLTTAPTIPDSVTDLSLTFMFDSKLYQMPNIPDSITTLDRTFLLCEGFVSWNSSNTLSANLETMRMTFVKCTNITYVPSLYNYTKLTNMYDAFQNCWKLSYTPNIPDSVTHMAGTFSCCRNLTNITNLPPNLVNMGAGGSDLIPELPGQHMLESGCFSYCTNLPDTNVPRIPNTVEDMCGTFAGCYTFVNTPTLPTSVINTAECFMSCRNLITTTAIPSNVTNVQNMFAGCTNLTGNIYVASNKIQDASNCFRGATAIKNLYIPFKNSDNSYSATYNTFKALGYDEETRKDGTILIDLADSRVLTINPDIRNCETTLEYNGNTIVQKGSLSLLIPNNTTVNYTAMCPGYRVLTNSFVINAHTTLDLTLVEPFRDYIITYDDEQYTTYTAPNSYMNIYTSSKESVNIAADFTITQGN